MSSLKPLEILNLGLPLLDARTRTWKRGKLGTFTLADVRASLDVLRLLLDAHTGALIALSRTHDPARLIAELALTPTEASAILDMATLATTAQR